MANRYPSKLSVFIISSLAVHIVVALWLTYTSRQTPSPVRGVVDVDFIQSATHEKAPARVAPARPGLKPAKDKPSEAPAPPVPVARVEGVPGDPQAIARASDRFLQEVSRIIDANKIYPREALRREEYGKVVVGVTINRDGSLAETRLEEPCPFASLNEAALKTVQTVHLPRLPDEVPAPLHLHIPLVYRLERR